MYFVNALKPSQKHETLYKAHVRIYLQILFVKEVNEFRGRLGGLFNFDWISIPLVYTQVIRITVWQLDFEHKYHMGVYTCV